MAVCFTPSSIQITPSRPCGCAGDPPARPAERYGRAHELEAGRAIAEPRPVYDPRRPGEPSPRPYGWKPPVVPNVPPGGYAATIGLTGRIEAIDRHMALARSPEARQRWGSIKRRLLLERDNAIRAVPIVEPTLSTCYPTLAERRRRPSDYQDAGGNPVPCPRRRAWDGTFWSLVNPADGSSVLAHAELAGKIAGSGVMREDAAWDGLVDASLDFDPSKGEVKPWIRRKVVQSIERAAEAAGKVRSAGQGALELMLARAAEDEHLDAPEAGRLVALGDAMERAYANLLVEDRRLLWALGVGGCVGPDADPSADHGHADEVADGLARARANARTPGAASIRAVAMALGVDPREVRRRRDAIYDRMAVDVVREVAKSA